MSLDFTDWVTKYFSLNEALFFYVWETAKENIFYAQPENPRNRDDGIIDRLHSTSPKMTLLKIP